MKNLIKIDPIAVKDKNDVVRALTILERIGIKRMTQDQKMNYLADENRTVNNNFMMQEDDGGFRIQSHYIGFGISVDNLEKQVNDIIEKQPDICERLNEIEEKTNKLRQEMNNLKSELNNTPNDFPVINIKE